MRMRKRRLDLLLVERGLFPTRSQAEAAIREGRVKVGGKAVEKPGTPVDPSSEVTVEKEMPFVSRGGVKLAHALDRLGINPEGKTCLDVGAGTGGFTDCLLKRGARKVYAVDVGRGQLAWKIRTDPRVVVRERVNARYLSREEVPEEIDLATVDVSFISCLKILPAVRDLLGKEGEMLILVKPQFEAGREKVGKGGVVRDPGVHREVLFKVASGAQALGLRVAGITPSPLPGAEGNREFFLWLKKGYPLSGEELLLLIEKNLMS